MNEFGQDHGLIHEVVVTGRKVGVDKDFWAALAHSEELFRKVMAFVAAALKPVFRLSASIDRDMTGWTCAEPVEANEGEFSPELAEFHNEGEVCVSGEEMVRRAKEQGGLTGIRHAEAMLRQQDKIPAEWRKYQLVFSEVWQDSGGKCLVACLDWHGGDYGGDCWCLGFSWLGAGFRRFFRLVRLRKLTRSNSPKG